MKHHDGGISKKFPQMGTRSERLDSLVSLADARDADIA